MEKSQLDEYMDLTLAVPIVNGLLERADCPGRITTAEQEVLGYCRTLLSERRQELSAEIELGRGGLESSPAGIPAADEDEGEPCGEPLP